MKYAIKVSKKGKDVLSSRGDELIYSSDFGSMKVIDSGTYKYTFGDDGDSSHYGLNIGKFHNLGYPPAVIMYYKFEDSPYYAYMPYWDSDLFANYYREWRYLASDTTVRLSYHAFGNGPDLTGKTFYFKYYIYANKSKAKE